jgi:hypothetical protein
MNSNKPAEPEVIPDILLDPGTKKRYVRGKFLGKVRLNIQQCEVNSCTEKSFST